MDEGEDKMNSIISKQPESLSVPEGMETVIRTVLDKVAEVYGLSPQAEVSVLLTDNETIHVLNKDYRDKDMPTDVLSFALNEGEEPGIIDGPAEELLGDIIISIERAAEQAVEYGHSLERETAFLTLHGMLHLLGYDHETEEERHEMRQEENHVLAILGIGR